MARTLAVFLGRPLAVAGPARAGVAFVWPRRRLRLALIAALCLPVLGVGGWLLLRNTSLAAVQDVRISGVHGHDTAQIEAALKRAAHGMSTLHVRPAALRAAVSQFPLVRDVRVSPSFPHGLHITVIEQPPVAVLLAAGQRTAVAGDGVVLGPGLLGRTLPSVRISGVAPLPGQRLAGTGTRAELSVLAAAPATLLGWTQSVANGSEGLVVTMRTGLELYFGNATRPHAKWLAAARVLADPSSAGASYIDVRLPERPVAGSSAPGGLSGASAPVGSSGESASTLAARLDEAVAGGASSAAAAATAAPSTGEPSTEQAAGESSASTEASASSPSTSEAPTQEEG
ncbi:MAG TPA: FtsQ-type POTRA domain-containing protein [Solirubrobacteraceae bacterium]|jgi:cell division protein FtsQ